MGWVSTCVVSGAVPGDLSWLRPATCEQHGADGADTLGGSSQERAANRWPLPFQGVAGWPGRVGA